MAWESEPSFRIQILMACGAFGALITLRPEPIWWALVILTIAAVLAAELFNTALERVVDRLHPEIHPLIAQAKDSAAGAVLVLSISAALIFAALMLHCLS